MPGEKVSHSKRLMWIMDDTEKCIYVFWCHAMSCQDKMLFQKWRFINSRYHASLSSSNFTTMKIARILMLKKENKSAHLFINKSWFSITFKSDKAKHPPSELGSSLSWLLEQSNLGQKTSNNQTHSQTPTHQCNQKYG
jgi:hypothetical protein